MVEPAKHPKYVTVHSIPPPEVDLSDNLYAEQTDERDQWNQLKWLVAGSIGSGTIDPLDPIVCIHGMAIVVNSFTNSIILSRTFYNAVHYKTRAEQFRTDLDLPLSAEKVIFLLSLMLEVDKMMKGSPSLFIDKLLPLSFIKRSFPFLTTLKYHALVWTPLGMTKIPEVWEKCGRPGGGLGKKLAEKVKAHLPTTQEPATSPANFIAIDSKAATEALTATALLGIVVGGILYIATLPESIAASIVLPVIQPDKKDHSM